MYKVAEDQYLNTGEKIYLGNISQKDLSYRVSKSQILIQESDTKQKLFRFTKAKKRID